MKRDTRTGILVASLALFNEHGEPATTTNDIANEADISPGNLHYHFRRKADVVEGLLAEFRADAGRVLQSPGHETVSLDDFWFFLHLVLELTAAYRFLFRDMESLVERYPKVQSTLQAFARGLAASFELHMGALTEHGILAVAAEEAHDVGRNLVVITLMTPRFDALLRHRSDAEETAFRVARGVFGMLKPHARNRRARAQIAELARSYGERRVSPA